MKIPFWMRIIFNRRREKRPVDKDRRGPPGTGGRHRQAEERLLNAIDDLEKTVSIKRDDMKRLALEAVNDRQQVVIFSTFREICRFSGPDLGPIRLCKHAEHPEAANSQITICEEGSCPVLSLAIKGAA